VRNLPVLLLSKSTFWMWLLYTDTTAGHDISKWFFYFLLYCLICNLSNSPTNIEMRSTLLFVLKYNSRNIFRIKASGISLWKTHLASFSNYVPSEIWIACLNKYTASISVVWYQNTIFNFQVLLYRCIIKLQSCHLLVSFPQFVIILLPTVNFIPVTKAHITAQHNSSYTNLWGLSFLYTLIWCPTYVAQICSSVAGLSHCGFDKAFYSDNPLPSSLCEACHN